MATVSTDPQPDLIASHPGLGRPSLAHCFGEVGNCTGPPAYLWLGSHGGLYALCVRCCAKWRGQMQGTPLGPVQVRSLLPPGHGAEEWKP